MENPDNQADDLRAVPNAVDLQSPDRKIVRRRFVQSTLFPLKAHDTKIENSGKKEVKTIEVIDDDNNNDDDDECCGSQGGKRKRRKNPKRNATPQKRASKKVANGKDSPTVAVADIESSDDGSPQKPKEKRRASARNGRTNGNKGTSPAKLLNHSSSTHQASQSVPDLRLEAKRTAEENSKLFAGKQLHPFFSIRKVAKKDPETMEVEANGCLGDRKERNADCGPIHVFDVVKDDLDSIDWSNWTFDDGTFSKATCDHQRMTCSLQSPVCSVNFDTIGVLNPLGMSLLFKDMSSGQCSGAPEDTSVIPTSFTPLVVDEEVTPHNLLKNIEKDFEVGKLDFITGNVGHLISDIEQRNSILLERIMSYYLNRHNHPENSLWISKYQPEKALEVCGNSEAVKFINEWLRLWHTTNFHVTKRSSGADKWLIREDDYDPYDSESDMENVDEASGLKNVLLVRGPVGSGKSAAIYACAREQGFQVVEVNASDWRNGALLKQKFGEALGSHRVKRSQESPVGSQSKLNLMSSPALVANGTASLDLNCGVVEEISLLEEDNSSADAADQSEIKTLILFEDVDATLCEDRGFVSTIQQLADTGKRPMILTISSENPVLPDNLDREEVCFTMPSFRELMHHLYMICAAEKANLQPHLIERCIQLCGGDIRKSLLYLQFWCQSQICVEDGKEQSLCSHLMFNLDAGHFTLPKLIPWELPSMLSEFIEAEITKSLYRIKMEENHSLLEVIEEEVGNPSMDHTLDPLKDEIANIEAKKEEILRRNCFLHVDNDFMAIGNISEFSNSSGSPVAFIRRNRRRKADTVLSDSEDDFHNHGNSAVADDLCDDGNNSGVPAVDSNFPIAYSAAVDTSCDPLYHSGAANVEVMNEFTGTAYLNQLNFSAVGDSCDQAIDHFVHCTEVHSAKNQHQLLQMVDANQNISVAVYDSLNPHSDQLLHFGEKKMETNNQLPVFGHAQNFSTMIDSRNPSPEKAIFFRQANTMETEVGNVNRCCQAATKYGLNPLVDQLEYCIETKVPVKRCLFSQAPCADPVSRAGGSICNQSTDQLIRCGESSLRELQPKHLEMEIVNHSNQEGKDDSLNPLFDQLVCHERANKENMEHQHLEGADVVPFSHLFGDFFNSSSEFHLVEAKGDEIKHQFPEESNNSSAAIGDSLNQSSHHLIGLAGLDVQQQYPGSAEVNPVSFSPMGDPLKQMSDRLCFEVQKLGNVKRQSPEIADFGIVRSPAPGKSVSPLNGKILQLSEENAEEHQCEFSEATKGNQVANHCQSVDISCVPESTFVPETEVNDGKELLSGADLVEFVSPVAADTVDSCFIRHKASEYMQCGRDINLNVGDEMGDSQSENEHIEASTSGCQVMDECSRMDFLKRSKISRSSRLAAKNPVQERWDELRKADMRQHSDLENKNALDVLELAYGVSNLISEADLLFHSGKLLTNDSIHQEAELDEESFTFGWHDQQVQMASSTAHHGYCLFCKDIDTLRSKMGIDNRMHLAWEMLASTNNSMALGKLLRLERSWSRGSLTGRSLKGEANSVDISSKRERESYLRDIVTSTVPAKCHMALRGYAFHDYLSSLAHISRSEASRLAEAAEKTKRRRVRITKNYLSSGGLDLSPEDISMLNEYYHSFRKVPSASTCAISR